METLSITIELTLGQWNVVLNALGQRPFVEVSDIISSIKEQGDLAMNKADGVGAALPADEEKV